MGDCGVVFVKHRHLFSKGFLISDKEKMRFEIMGEQGGEKIGISFRNINSHEQKHLLKQFLNRDIEKHTWKVVEIKLDKYGYATRSDKDKSYLHNFSVFTNTNMSKDSKLIVYIRGIAFI